jgi:hypothetical protein
MPSQTVPKSVPNTTTFDFNTVGEVVYNKLTPAAGTNLDETFTHAINWDGIFDPMYSGNTDQLLNFRNYTRCYDSTGATSISGNAYFCENEYSILTVSGGTLGTSAYWVWYLGGCGTGTMVGVGPSIQASSGGTYYVRAEGPCNDTACVSKYLSGYTNYAVSVSISTGTTWVCDGSSVTLTATTVNGGSSPVLQWQLYDWETGNWVNWATGVTFTFTPDVYYDSVRCRLTSSLVGCCLSNNPAYSNSIRFEIKPIGSVVVVITSIPSDYEGYVFINSGQSVNFQILSLSGTCGNPGYQWQKFNYGGKGGFWYDVTTGGTGSTYLFSNPVYNDKVRLEVTSDCDCTNLNYSNEIIILTASTTICSASVSVNPTWCCSGSTAVFTCVQSGYTSPTYRWDNFGVVYSGTGSAYSAYTYTAGGGGQNRCIVSQTGRPTKTGNTVYLYVYPVVVPSLTIGGVTTICSTDDTLFLYKETYYNGGNNPTWQWYKNGTSGSDMIIGQTNYYYNTYCTNVTNGDTFYLKMTSSATCASPTYAFSSGKVITVTERVWPFVSIGTSVNCITNGASITYTAQPLNGGTSPTYVWKRNGSTVSTSSTYVSSTITPNDYVRVTMTSNATCIDYRATNPCDSEVVRLLYCSGQLGPNLCLNGGGDDTTDWSNKTLRNIAGYGDVGYVADSWFPMVQGSMGFVDFDVILSIDNLYQDADSIPVEGSTNWAFGVYYIFSGMETSNGSLQYRVSLKYYSYENSLIISTSFSGGGGQYYFAPHSNSWTSTPLAFLITVPSGKSVLSLSIYSAYGYGSGSNGYYHQSIDEVNFKKVL